MDKKTTTPDEVLAAVRYEPETGLFRYARSSPTTRVGDIAGSKDSKGYIRIQIGRRYFRAHRLAWLLTYGKAPDSSIDHINGIRSDNRIANLRTASHQVNCQNMRKASVRNKSSGLLGVTASRGRWLAQISINGESHFLGRFQNANDAHCAYVAAKRQLHEGCTL